jgi:hypothetical protein
VLYGVHSLSERKAFDAATFAFMSLFLTRVLEAGGVGQTEEESALEQVTLALGIIQFHAPECKSSTVLYVIGLSILRACSMLLSAFISFE